MNLSPEESAGLYVLDQLEPRERAEFEARLLRDPALAARVGELESALAAHIKTLPQHAPPPDGWARIEDLLDDEPAVSGHGSGRPSAAWWIPAARWGVAAVIAIGVSIIAVQELRRAPVAAARQVVLIVGLDSHRSMFAELPMRAAPQSADSSFIELASLAEKYWGKPADLPAGVGGAETGNRGYALFDPASNQGFIAIQQLPSPGAGQRYHLWIVDTESGRVREAGILPLNGADRGLFFFSLARAAGVKSGRLNFFVTAEEGSTADSDRPHGKVVLGDNRI